MKSRLIAGLAAILIVMSSATAVQAQSQSQSQAADTQGGGVARISLIHGEVTTQRGDSGDWSTAALNAPIVSGDRVAAGERSRTELQLDYANILRLDERTEANVTGLTRTQIQIQLARGLADYSVLKDSEADVEIDAPNLSVHPRRGDGRYQITVYADDRAEVVVRKGEADISTPQGSTHVRSGQMITVTGTGDATQYHIAEAPSRDDFDRWASDRDNTIRNAQAWSRTNRYYVGSEDLDAYGRWTNVPDYGDVWVPVVASGWAPYRDGRWVWEPYWGWTWVAYEPWGWAPYHYGRWFLYGGSWAWWPGYSSGYRSYYRPVWAPAYVSFFGFGGGVGVGFSFGGGWGSVGWLPIGPCDGFYPWWGSYRSRFNVVNIYNVHNVYNIHNYAGGIPPLRRGTTYSNLRLAAENERMRQAISVVPSHDFGRGRITAQPVSREMFREGRMVAGNLPVVPGRESLAAGERRAAAPSFARGAQTEKFFSTNRTAPARPQSFDREVSDLHSAIQRDGRFTPITGGQRTGTSATNPRTYPEGRIATENSNMIKSNAGQPANGRGPVAGGNNGGNVGSNGGSNSGSNQNWRRMGSPVQQPNGATGGAAAGTANPAPRRSGENSDWRRGPNAGTPRSNAGDGAMTSGSASGRVNTPADRPSNPAPQSGGQDWRRINRPSEPTNRGVTTEAPASRGPQTGQSMPTQDRGNDWRRIPSPEGNNGSMERSNGGGSAATGRDSGNWRQPVQSDSGRAVSRPSLDMRQPIVTPRSSGGYSGGGNSGGGNHGGSVGRPAPSGGGGHASPPSHSGGGQPHGGGASGPHRGR